MDEFASAKKIDKPRARKILAALDFDQESIDKMGAVMQQMGTRDTDLEDRIESLKGQIQRRLKALGG
jgi:anti-sigma28 factor (negative regulator of flagellin synthesis)